MPFKRPPAATLLPHGPTLRAVLRPVILAVPLASLLATLLAALVAALTVSGARQARAAFIDRGDINGDGVIDLSDAVLLFDWLTQHPDKAVCLGASDTNRDGKVDYSDGIYLLRYMFLSGEEPTPFVADGEPGCYSPEGTFEIQGLTITPITPRSAVVAWQTAVASDSRVRYGKGSALDAGEVVVDESVTYHQVVLRDLEAATGYSVSVASASGDGSSTIARLGSFRTLPTPSIEVTAGHPRIFFTEKDLPAIRARIAPGGTHEEPWKAIVGWCENRLDRDAAEILASDHFLLNVRTLAFAGLVGKVSSYRKKAVELAIHCAREDGGKDIRAAIESLAYVYDWLHASLGSAEKSEIAGTLFKFCKGLRGAIREDEYVTGRSHGDNKSYFLGALALWGDDARVSPYLAEAVRHYQDGFIATWRRFASGDGGTSKGWWYATLVLPYELEFLIAWRSASGQDWFPQEREWCENALNWFLFGMRGDGSLLRDGDTWIQYGLEQQNRTYGLVVAREYRNSQAQWFADETRKVAGLWAPHAVFDVLWHDPSVPSFPPAGVTSRWFRNVGTVVCRESWASDAAVACFRSAEVYTLGHSHRDDCSFTIHYKGDLAIDSGTYDDYGSAHYENYYSRTIAHNSILVHDPDEVFTKYGKVYANDGGQRWLVKDQDVGSWWPPTVEATVDRAAGFRLGGIPRYEDGAGYTYALGDGGPSYSRAKLKKFHRHFLWLGRTAGWPRPVVVVFDDVVATKDSFRKTYLLHTQKEPTVDGSLVTAHNGEGVLYQHTVMPSDATIRAVGGKGKEYLVEGVNWAPIKPPAEKEDAGAWRVEVSPVSKAKDHRFLHVLFPGDEGTAPPPRPKSLSTGSLRGATIGEWTVLFGFGSPLVVVEYVSEGLRTKHLIAGVVPRAKYSIFRDGLPEDAVVASSAGILRFDLELAGTVRVVAEP